VLQVSSYPKYGRTAFTVISAATYCDTQTQTFRAAMWQESYVSFCPQCNCVWSVQHFSIFLSSVTPHKVLLFILQTAPPNLSRIGNFRNTNSGTTFLTIKAPNIL